MAITGCGGSSARSACAGLPTLTAKGAFSLIVGQVQRKRFVCRQFGDPRSVKQLSGGHQLWTYGRGPHSIGTLTVG